MIGADTADIRHRIGSVQVNQREILDQMDNLRKQSQQNYQFDHGQEQEQRRIEQWLDALSHYAETVVGREEPMEDLDVDSLVQATEQFEVSSNTTTNRNSDSRLPEALGGLIETPFRLPEGSFPLLEVYDPHWWEKIRNYLAEPELSYEFIKENQKDIIEFLRNEKAAFASMQSTDVHEGSSQSSSGKKHQKTTQPVTNGEPREIPYHIVASTTCSSKIMACQYCETLDVWATLHKDHYLRLWKADTAELISSLLVLKDLRKLQGACKERVILMFCPAEPNIILVNAPCLYIEVWNWVTRRQHIIEPEVVELLTEPGASRLRFVPQSNVVYTADYSTDFMGYLTLVDIASKTECECRKIPFRLLPGYKKGQHVKIIFMSSSKFWILWEPSLPQPRSPWGTFIRHLTPLAPSRVIVICLPGSLSDQRPSLWTRYSDSAVKEARVIAQYEVAWRPYCMDENDYLDHETGRLTTIDSDHFGELTAYTEPPYSDSHEFSVIDLDTGTLLFLTKKYSRLAYILLSHEYVYTEATVCGTCQIISVKNGSCLGTLPVFLNGSMLKSGKIVTLRYVNSTVEFSITDVTMEELAKGGGAASTVAHESPRAGLPRHRHQV